MRKPTLILLILLSFCLLVLPACQHESAEQKAARDAAQAASRAQARADEARKHYENVKNQIDDYKNALNEYNQLK